MSAVVQSIDGPVLLVGTPMAAPSLPKPPTENANVRGLVYVAGFAPETGESSFSLSALYPGSTLGETLAPVALPDGGQDLYIGPARFHQEFAADVSDREAALIAATQLPVTLTALQDSSDVALWKNLPSCMIYGSAERNIPPAVMRFMSERAHARSSLVVDGMLRMP